jgi:DNA helicase II / ATP-dependent DNA helicase PcrA
LTLSVEPSVAGAILREYPELNEAQREAIAQTEGPLLLIAGPGSGKTHVMVLRTLNVLLRGLAEPREVVVCTFTEKAAFELRDRIAAAARKLHYDNDLSELTVGTIHGMCNDFLLKHLHRTPMARGYEVLDELTQMLFLFDNFEAVIGSEEHGMYLGQWTTKWNAIEGARAYFDKITEELIDPDALLADADPFLHAVREAYVAYERSLIDQNRVDFAHQQKLFHNLLSDPDVGPSISRSIRYVMVDEYQDTNYVQEQILLKLAQSTQNVCVVGDEDQSLYRFRGATVRNILEFPTHFESCRIIELVTNYRSHSTIVGAYNKFMEGADWSGPEGGRGFRYDKQIVPDPQGRYPQYPAVFAIWGSGAVDEGTRFADFVAFLKENSVIQDYSQVALLLHSVRTDHSGHYIEALRKKGIPAYCPRARGYFAAEEIRDIVSCLAVVLEYYGAGRGQISARSLQNLAAYVDSCIADLGARFPHPHPLAEAIRGMVSQVSGLRPGQSLDRRLPDFFYELLSYEPFAGYLKNENRARSLAIFSQLLNVFQSYYHYTVISAANRVRLRFQFFNSFLRLLHEGGINEFEDPDQPFPKGYVQVMTIHQSKGLEFPVVAVGSLHVQTSSPKQVDRHLSAFYHRPPFEPTHRITAFDRMRLHYVAFSRAEKILVLTSHESPKAHFKPIWQGLEQWPYVQKDLLSAQSFVLRNRMRPKKSFSFTGDLKVYETCPRQYQYFREYDFTPSRSAVIFFGLLVHQTIEDIHRVVLDGRLEDLNRDVIRQKFDANVYNLSRSDVRPVGPAAREAAFKQVMNYFTQNKGEMSRVIETEVDVSLEKEDYILTGKIDLLLGGDGKLELLDFKSQVRPEENDPRLRSYYDQLCLYAHILERRTGQRPDRLLLYWTGEEKKSDALMTFPYQPEDVEGAGERFDEVVDRILLKDFAIVTPPGRAVCKECDLRSYCWREGTIKRIED